MNIIRRFVGIICMLLGPAVIAVLLISAFQNIDLAGKSDINKPVPWAIIIFVFTPIAIGLMIFGWYAWKGEYERLPEKSSEI
jgi:uncharacterized membrane protein YadS